MALRALEASQGTMKQNGVTYGRDAAGGGLHCRVSCKSAER